MRYLRIIKVDLTERIWTVRDIGKSKGRVATRDYEDSMGYEYVAKHGRWMFNKTSKTERLKRMIKILNIETIRGIGYRFNFGEWYEKTYGIILVAVCFKFLVSFIYACQIMNIRGSKRELKFHNELILSNRKYNLSSEWEDPFFFKGTERFWL